MEQRITEYKSPGYSVNLTQAIVSSKLVEEEDFGSSLFCMGHSIAPLSTEADYMKGVLNAERPHLSKIIQILMEELPERKN
jgi:hypothetical protein